MSNLKYKKIEDNVPDPEIPPPYSAKYPSEEMPSIPPQYQPYYCPPGAESNKGPSQTIFVTHAQSIHGISHEPDYMAYSIFTMLCCCLPLGIAALVFSIQTQEANRVGNSTAAQRSSRLARILATTALGVGLGFLILYIILLVISSTYHPPQSP